MCRKLASTIAHRLFRSISGLVVKSVVAIDGPRVRFTADATDWKNLNSFCFSAVTHGENLFLAFWAAEAVRSKAHRTTADTHAVLPAYCFRIRLLL
jgi:hypothetical protein